MNVFCRNCGQRIPEAANVCGFCNYKQEFKSFRDTTHRNSDGVVAFFVCLLFGWLGIHRFVYGKIGTGILMFLTGGGCGIWWFVDIIRIGVCNNFTDSKGRPLSLIHSN
ncbi:TM2 domain-containing protein [Vibrio cidicii]|uniref:TM2 domain-containing protein n=1 Tax=Vibrio cidicii TaxID=1763883 RepID=UPI0018C2460B